MRKTLASLTLVAALLLPVRPAAALELDHDLLALVAMPLAVAAVSEITDVPQNDLIDMVSLLNDAGVEPVQFVEVVRYVPVALVVQEDTTQPRFIEVVREREQAGLRGTALVTFIEERLNFYGLPSVNLDVTAPQLVGFDDDFDLVPAVVRTRIAETKPHPHGGPPGQLKKAAGVQTGAEIVHQRKNDRKNDRNDVRVTKERQAPKPQKVAKHAKHAKENKGNKGNNGKGKG